METLLFVSGGPGLQFSFPTGDAACESPGATPPATPSRIPSGIQAPNADHQFGDRVFQTPHLFVMEKIQQPVRAVIKNSAQSTLPLRVDIYLGFNPQVSNVMIQPGECKAVVTNDVLPLNPHPSGAEIRVEVCSPKAGPSISCMTSAAFDDFNIAYFATIGDIATTSITNCILFPLLDACRSPSTFFWEQPKDQMNAIMTVNGGQNPGGPVPDASVSVEMYVNGQLQASDAGPNPVVTVNNL